MVCGGAVRSASLWRTAVATSASEPTIVLPSRNKISQTSGTRYQAFLFVLMLILPVRRCKEFGFVFGIDAGVVAADVQFDMVLAGEVARGVQRERHIGHEAGRHVECASADDVQRRVVFEREMQMHRLVGL